MLHAMTRARTTKLLNKQSYGIGAHGKVNQDDPGHQETPTSAVLHKQYIINLLAHNIGIQQVLKLKVNSISTWEISRIVPLAFSRGAHIIYVRPQSQFQDGKLNKTKMGSTGSMDLWQYC